MRAAVVVEPPEMDKLIATAGRRTEARTSQRADESTGAVRVGEAPSDAVPAAAL
jgi:hypothetical protein